MAKQIIIDGVDVSGCEFYNKDDKTCREANGKYNIDICDFDKCENSNCYYKNWQRKAENERLEEQLELNTANAVVIDMVERLYKLKQTLKEIKEIAKGTNPAFLDNDDVVLEILQKISECEGNNE